MSGNPWDDDPLALEELWTLLRAFVSSDKKANRLQWIVYQTMVPRWPSRPVRLKRS